MPQHQEKTKQLRAREIENTKRRREQELQKKQQQQPPARSAQPQQPQRGTQQPARQPTVILPDYTERAEKLGELIALYLKGSWGWNEGMQMARQYAPNGTTEAELRAAVMHAAKVQGNTGNLAVRALVQPEVVHPEVNISDLPKQSLLQNVARGLQAPLRSVAAGATQLAGKKNPRGQYGKESGGKPFRAPQSFAESYASDPTFGSALELAFPDTPQWFRVLLGGALDFALDPVNLVGAKPVKTVVSTVGKAVGSTRAVQKVAEPVKRVAGAVGTRVMHPTAAKQVAKQAPAGQKVKSLSELGKAMEQVPVYSFTRNVGNDMLELRKQLDEIIQRANEQGINIPKAHNILDFEKYVDELKQTVDGRVAEKIDDVLKRDLNQIDQIETQIRAVSPELADKVQKLKSEIDKHSDMWYRQAEHIAERWVFNPRVGGNKAIYDAMWEGARAVYRREILPKHNIVYRTIDAWKRTKTIYNLGTHTRNFLQNFLFRYLTGDVDVADILRLPTAVRDMIRFRRMVDDIASQGGNININDVLNRYRNFHELAFGLALAKNKASRLRSLQSIFPQTQTPMGWDSLIHMFPNQELIKNILMIEFGNRPPNLDDVIRAGTLARERGIPISQLPRNWGDVLLFPFRRFGEIVREARAKQQSLPLKAWDVIHNTAYRAYNAGDLIPALLMEAVRRRKALKSGEPTVLLQLLPSSSNFRMDYSAVPEAIGKANIALLPFVNYQYFALRGLRDALRKNPERVYNIIAKPIERSTRITQADDEQGVSQAPRFGFKEREMFPASPTRGIPYSSILPIDPQFAEPFLSLSGWVSRSPLTAIARPFVENRDDTVRLVDQLVKEFTPATFQHLAYAIFGEPQRGIQPVLQHTRGERLLRALGINIQPIDQMRIARQQQRQAEQQRNQPLYEDPATITGIVRRVLRYFGW